jgi:predicted PurR-regulated permease PerM
MSASFSSRDMLRVGAILAGIYVALQLLWLARSILLVTFLAVLFGLCLSALVDYLARWRIPRGAGAALIVLLVLGCFAGIGALVAPRIGAQMGELQRQLPGAIRDAGDWVESRYRGVIEIIEQPSADSANVTPTQDSTRQTEAAPSIRQGVADQIAGLGGKFFAVFSSTLAGIAGLILLVFVAIYVAVDPGLYHAGIMHLFPHRMRRRAGEVLSEVATMLRRWLLAQLVAMAVIGSVSTVALLLLGVHAPIALGIIAGLLEFVPYVGPILSAIPAIAMGFLSGPQVALGVALAYLCIQQAENHLLIPLLMKRGLDLPPVVTIVSQAVMGLVFGVLGLLVAVPLVGAVMVLVRMLYVEDVVGDEVPLPGQA